MEELENFWQKIEQVTQGDKAYKFEAYSFVLAALHHTVAKLPKSRHVTGGELLEGIRFYALEQFGPMARTVLNYWGVHETEDFGQIVFALVEIGILRKQPEDTLQDFKNVYRFDEAFDRGYKFDGEDA